MFNTFFVNIGRNLAKTIQKPINYKEKKIVNCHSMFFGPTSITEIKNIISELKNKKAPG